MSRRVSTYIRMQSGYYDKETKTLYIGKKPFGIRTYENLLEDLENPEYDIELVNLEDISIGKRAKELILQVYELGVPLKLNLAHEQELIGMVNSGTKQIDTMGYKYVEWVIKKTEELNNPFMVVEIEGKTPSIVQYLGEQGDSIRLKKIRTYATQPYICDRELKLGRDIYSIITINKSDILNKKVVWRFVGTGLEQAIVETLTQVIEGQLSFQQ